MTEASDFHLGRTAAEAALFECQHAALCYIEAFSRHIAAQLVAVTGNASYSAEDCIVLHAIGLGGRARSIPDIQHFTNRSDLANVQYSVRKLVKGGLVTRARPAANRGASYILTPLGTRAVEAYVEARKTAIEGLVQSPEALIEDWRVTARALRLLTAAYDHAARVAHLEAPDP